MKIDLTKSVGELWLPVEIWENPSTYASSGRNAAKMQRSFSLDAIFSKRILVVEDDRLLSRILNLKLSNAGFDVAVAYDGDAAVERAFSESFVLFILDYRTPGLRGDHVCRKIRSIARYGDTPVFFCTGHSEEAEFDALAIELMVSRRFQKPFSPQKLVEASAEVLGVTAAAT